MIGIAFCKQIIHSQKFTFNLCRLLANHHLHTEKHLLGALVHVLCPTSTACLINHLLKLSRFSNPKRNDWIAFITVVSWDQEERACKDCSPQNGNDLLNPDSEKSGKSGKSKYPHSDPEKGESSTHARTSSADTSNPSNCVNTPQKSHRTTKPDTENPTNRMEIEPICLPHKLETLVTTTQLNNEGHERLDVSLPAKLMKKSFKPQVSYFVLATNGFGDFRKCTIMSELLTNKDLEENIAEKSKIIWRKFVHQPQTGRCLLFLQVLKVVISRMTGRYRDALNTLESVLDLDVRTNYHV